MKVQAIALLILLLAVSCLSAPLSPANSASAQSSPSSCDTNHTLTIAMNGGVPNSFNGINTFTTTGGYTERLSFLALYPPPDNTGGLYYPDSVVDWFNSNANYTEWTFNIRPGLKWSDGTNVSSSDVVNTFSNKFALNATADVQGLRFEIVNVKALNSSATEFILNKTDAHLPEKLSGVLYSNVMPASFIAQGAFFTGFNGAYPADGPFVIQNYTSGSPQAVLTPNPYYTPHPAICKVVVDFVESQSEVSTLLQAGTADLGAAVPYEDVSNILAHSPSIHLLDEKQLLDTVLSYNDTIYPYNMTAFRQALAYGINQSQVIQQGFAGLATPGYASEGGIPNNVRWYSPNQTTYSFDQQKALTLLKSIGITKNAQGQLTYPNGTVITLQLWSENDYSADVTASTVVQSNLQSLGFKVNYNPPTLQSNIIADTYANTNGIDSAMLIDTDEACAFGFPYLDALPVWQVCLPLAAPPTWLEPSSAQAQYMGNLTALDGTANASQEFRYLANIQALNSQYLPVIHLNFADDPIMYSTARWTNWPKSSISDGYGIEFNNTAIALLQPVSGGTTSATAQTSTSSSSATGAASSSATGTATSAATSLTSTTAATTSSSSGQNNTLTYAAIAIIVIIIIIAAAIAFTRRGGRRQPPGAT